MSEMALTADHVIVVGQGRLLRDQPMADFIAAASNDVVRVRSPQAPQLGDLLGRAAAVRRIGDDGLEVEGLSSEEIGTTAASAQITLYELSTQGASLEEAYMALTADAIDFRSGGPQTAAAGYRDRPAAA
jgi:ABC-2 type transport system ATP-binding protein